VISERMDNLIHASATHDEAEREIKLWFKPCDIPPLMRVYPTDICQEHYYLSQDKLYNNYEPDSVCLFAPGDVVWQSDLEILRLWNNNAPDVPNLGLVTAKYLINRKPPDY